MANAEQQQSSPLLNLPPELRCMIYKMTLDEELDAESITLHEMKIPTMLQICKQIRHEAMQNFFEAFSTRHINTLVGSNMQARKSRRTKCPFTTKQDLQREDAASGTLGLKPEQEEFLRAAGGKAGIFKNFTLQVYSATQMEWVKHICSRNPDTQDREGLLRQREKLKVFDVRIVCESGGDRKIEGRDGMAHPKNRAFPSRKPGWFGHEDVAIAQLRLENVISKFDSESDGFTL